MLMNAWVYPLMAIFTVLAMLLFPVLFLSWMLVTRRTADRVTRQMIRLYGKGVLVLLRPFVRILDDGFQQLRIPGIIVANHLSIADTYLLSLMPVWDVRICLRSWPFRLYWYRPFMVLARYLDIESTEWSEVLATARQSFERGEGFMIFPEGHRSRTGELGHFHSGAFRLSVATGQPVYALCITGTEDLLPPSRWFMKPASIRIRTLGPFQASGDSSRQAHVQLQTMVRSRIAAELIAMRVEAVA